MLAFSEGPSTTSPEVARDVAKLVAAARKLDKAWPWQPAIPEVKTVAAHGKAAARALLAELRYVSREQWVSNDSWDLHVEQQVALALCEIYGVMPESGGTVYGIRSEEQNNEKVRKFWRRKVDSAK